MTLDPPASPAAFAERAIAYVTHFTASVTSWFRSPKHNAAVGGVNHSAHVGGLAVDVVYDVRPPLEEAQALAATLGLRVIREGDHDHLQPLHWRAG